MKFYDFYTITAPFDIFLASLLAWAFTLKDVFIYFMFGYIFNFLINYVLKGLFMVMLRNHCFIYRPETNFPKSGCGFYPKSSKNNLCCKEVNFPSTFGQIIGYFVSFIFAYVVYQETNVFAQVTSITLILIYSIFICLNQLLRNCETALQMFIGFLLGITWGLGYFFILEKLEIFNNFLCRH